MDFSKKSCVEEYFHILQNEISRIRIKSIFSMSSMSWNHHREYRTYDTDEEIYILFENEYCLVIDYRFIDELNIQYRKLNFQEQKEFDELYVKDWFNTTNEICDYCTGEAVRMETCKLEYGSIEGISLRPVTEEYDKWVDQDIDLVMPDEDTFDEIRFSMSNGKSFTICAGDAEIDGYTFVWSEDAEETIAEM